MTWRRLYCIICCSCGGDQEAWLLMEHNYNTHKWTTVDASSFLTFFLSFSVPHLDDGVVWRRRRRSMIGRSPRHPRCRYSRGGDKGADSREGRREGKRGWAGWRTDADGAGATDGSWRRWRRRTGRRGRGRRRKTCEELKPRKRNTLRSAMASTSWYFVARQTVWSTPRLVKIID